MAEKRKGPIIREGGLVPENKRVMLTREEWRNYEGDPRINVGPLPADAWKYVTDIFRKKDARRGGISEPPAPGGFTGGFNYGGADTEKIAEEVAYKMILGEIKKDGYNVIELPAAEMRRKFDNAYGFERGNEIYIGADHAPGKKTEIAYHEWRAKKLSQKSGRPHNEFHPQVEAEQGPETEKRIAAASDLIQQLFN